MERAYLFFASTMSNRQPNLFYTAARSWVEVQSLRPTNVLLFVQFLMLEAARQHPEYRGLAKKELVRNTLSDVLEDASLREFVHGVPNLELARDKLVESWIDQGITVHKTQPNFKSPESDAPHTLDTDVVAKIANVAEQWFEHRVVTASNIIVGISKIMEAVGQFFQGDAQTKKDLVLRTVKEIVLREATQLATEDREAILAAIDTFGGSVVNYLVDMLTGNFDFKGFVEKIKNCCLPLSPCCRKKEAATKQEEPSL